MKVVWIGAGNIATQLGMALAHGGHETLQVFSRTLASASVLAERLGCDATDNPDAVVAGADVYLFAVKDSVLESLIARIVPRVGEALFLHTAGSMPMAVFEASTSRYGVMYPMQTFTKDRPVDFSEIPFFIEGCDRDTYERIKLLAETVSQRVIFVSTEQRRVLHLAAVFACNFVNHCYALSEELLQREGIPFDVMWPLIDETARKVHYFSPRKAQTGPAVRYDRNVINRQLQMLEGEPEMRELYRKLSQSIHNWAFKE
ncbi:Rossmann-like and DUF2520 domain-containing protein [Phocaeicola sartorii]|uniref:Rossmann-like and DUF2520 domain-containing protein n=2 Tax=Bacteroidaceae TaxID=815 RepID=UPI002589F048|nr:Rossmann-like and DUF2520 domain-containing protein [Phocaeicola sartorii]